MSPIVGFSTGATVTQYLQALGGVHLAYLLAVRRTTAAKEQPCIQQCRYPASPAFPFPTSEK